MAQDAVSQPFPDVGHLGDVTVEHVAHHLPIIVEEFLATTDQSQLSDPSFISSLFTRSILAFDKAIAGDVLDLFGGSVESLSNYTDAEIRSIINDQHKGGHNFRKARLNMYGTTALVTLVDAKHENLWVANVGDCQAGTHDLFLLLWLVLLTPLLVMVSPLDDDQWDIKVLTTEHNGLNDAEIERVRQLHPGEPECILDRRVLGALAPFRCKLISCPLYLLTD